MRRKRRKKRPDLEWEHRRLLLRLSRDILPSERQQLAMALLVAMGHIHFEEKEGHGVISLTESGKAEAERFRLELVELGLEDEGGH